MDEERRNWVNEGIAQFSELVRIHQNDGDQFYHKTLSFLVNYIKAQQGSLFIEEMENEKLILTLAACYAFDKRKWVEQKIEIGDGLIGQAYLEGTPVILKQVPSDYVKITSGLGIASPRSLVIIPIKHDDKTVAIMEYASFEELKDFQIQFLEKTGEHFASAIFSGRTTSRMKQLLDEAAIRENRMKQREEELSQNMEELQAIQEEMHRKQKELS
jgi:GAF domain-containing protein